MALLDSAYKQRMVGALVLVALAVIFLPMLFSRQDEQRQVVVEAPAAPQAPTVPQVQVEPVVVPEPQALPEEPVPSDADVAAQQAPSIPVQPSVPVVKPAPAPAPAPAAPVVAVFATTTARHLAFNIRRFVRRFAFVSVKLPRKSRSLAPLKIGE